MAEENKTKRYIFIGLGIALVIALIVCFAIAAKNIKSGTSSTLGGKTASQISSEYDNIDYGSTQDVENLGVVTITNGGSYNLSGTYEQIIINTNKDVELNLNNVTITCTAGPAINVIEADTVSIVLTGTNKVTATTTEDLDGAIYSKADLVFSGTGSLEVKSNYDGIVSKDTLVIKSGTYIINASDDGIRGKDNVAIVDGTFTINAGGDGIKSTNEEDSQKGYIAIDGGTFNITAYNDGIQAETNLTIKDGEFTIKTTASSDSYSAKGLKAGNLITIEDGKYTINTTDDGIHSNGNITINNGEFTINSKDDAIHADGIVEINNGTFTITAAEGIEATYIKINDGTISISASDDGINAGQKSDIGTPTVEINGGNITITMGQGDTDGVDSNGDIIINGGTISVTGQSTFDYDGTGKINGGTVICNGEEVTTLPNQMMGGEMIGGPQGDMQNGGRPQGRRY